MNKNVAANLGMSRFPTSAMCLINTNKELSANSYGKKQSNIFVAVVCLLFLLLVGNIKLNYTNI